MKFYFLSILFFLSFQCLSQVYLDVQKLVNNSDLIVEGKVISQSTFMSNGHVYTANQLEVLNVVYQGVQSKKNVLDTVNIVTLGGYFEGQESFFYHVLNLSVGMQGLFYIQDETDKLPSNPSTNNYYGFCYGDEQGFILYDYDVEYNFKGLSYFETISSIDSLLVEINNYTPTSTSTTSYIVEQSSGVLFKVSDGSFTSTSAEFEIDIKSIWGKEFDINSGEINLAFEEDIDLSTYNLNISSSSTILNSNYSITWSQPTLKLLKIEINKIDGDFFRTKPTFDPFINLSIDIDFIANNMSSIEFSKFRYNLDNNDYIFSIIKKDLNTSILDDPEIFDFSPSSVMAGIREDDAFGSNYEGYVIIEGENFGDLPDDNLAMFIPDLYRVMFKRFEGTSGSNSFNVTPTPDDYEYWDDDEIKVWVPTRGRRINGVDNILDAFPQRGISKTGKIRVVTPEGDDLSSDELDIRVSVFNHQSTTFPSFGTDPFTFADVHDKGYRFIFAPNFDNLEGGSISSLKNEVRDAFCAWNSLTDINFEILENSTDCTNDNPCGVISAANFNTGGDDEAMAAGVAFDALSGVACDDPHVFSMQVSFNTNFNWISRNTPILDDDERRIYYIALHEIGHLIGLAHVEDEDQLMAPIASENTIDIDADEGANHLAIRSDGFIACGYKNAVMESCLTSVQDLENRNQVKVYPTITSDQSITISSLSTFEKINQIQLVTSNGLLIESKKISDYTYSFPTFNLVSGTYFIKVKTESRYEIHKIIVIK